jgi:2',3'-cyclic-nucleotide 2'-phosphodiesterase (5'-nucleotidase family)
MEERKARGIRWIVAIMLAAAVGLWVLAIHAPPVASQAAESAEGELKVTLLHVNDTHGQLLGLDIGGRNVGGAARLATAVQKVRQTSSANRVFLVHCGDEFSRGDALTQRSAGAANVAVMNHLGFDLWVLGNGEFYGGVELLRQRIAEIKFPTLAANVSLGEGEALTRPYVIERAGPIRLAFLGLCTVSEEGEKGEKDAPVKAADPIETARDFVPQLRRQADVVVAVTHLGLSEDLRLVAAVEGIDLVLGSHSHTVLKHGFRAKGPDGRQVLICQAGDKYRYLGQVDLELTPSPSGQGWRLVSVTASLIGLDETVQPDPATTALLTQLAKGPTQPAPPIPRPMPRSAATSVPSIPVPAGN